MKKLIEIEQLTNLKYLNMFKATYKLDNNKDVEYCFSSRKNKKDLVVFGKLKSDAVRVLPYIIENGKKHVVLIKEFRYPINNYIYSTPAGIIEEGETSIQTVVRELEEEIGATVIALEKVQDMAYSSAGMTDESLELYEAEVSLNKLQNLEETEDITFLKVELNDLLDFVNNNQFELQSAMLLKMFYYKYLELKGR